MSANTIVEKTTIMKSAEPLKIKAVPFAKGHRLEITWQADPFNPLHLDQVTLSRERSAVRQMIKLFEENIMEGDLKSKLLTDDGS